MDLTYALTLIFYILTREFLFLAFMIIALAAITSFHLYKKKRPESAARHKAKFAAAALFSGLLAAYFYAFHLLPILYFLSSSSFYFALFYPNMLYLACATLFFFLPYFLIERLPEKGKKYVFRTSLSVLCFLLTLSLGVQILAYAHWVKDTYFYETSGPLTIVSRNPTPPPPLAFLFGQAELPQREPPLESHRLFTP